MNGIKVFREKAGLTQTQLAEKMETSQSAIAMWESGSCFPRSSILPKLAQVLNCSIDDLYQESA